MANTTAIAKKVCNVTRDEFSEHAESLQVSFNGVPLLAEPKEFSTGSFGWYLGGKLTLKVNGKLVTLQIGLNATVIGSKEA